MGMKRVRAEKAPLNYTKIHLYKLKLCEKYTIYQIIQRSANRFGLFLYNFSLVFPKKALSIVLFIDKN